MKPFKDYVEYHGQYQVWYTEKQLAAGVTRWRRGGGEDGIKADIKFDYLTDLHVPGRYKDSFGIQRDAGYTVISIPVQEWAAKIVEANYLGTEWNNE